MPAEAKFTLKRSARARRLSVAVAFNGLVTVTAPIRISESGIAQFIRDQAEWIARTLAKMNRKNAGQTILPRDRASYLLHKSTARDLVRELLAIHAPRLGLPYQDVRIKDMTRNWGSCSTKGNLNFNYKIALIPRELAEYVVIHELAHLAHFDHSPRFWRTVASGLPDWHSRRTALKKFHA